ncbi:hypothetical protein PCANC_24564 [Puccinia coronata f. sp. avenae]|uniref:Uncharacterized protein n=1 Tax=Puccinia coronata f. sp. avenae TaxID=200324 RepID=A0A2N5TIZ0_9BASI|nr:hypothetical protein PCANC_24564 [Puccinia coronata f. sp. avenae]
MQVVLAQANKLPCRYQDGVAFDAGGLGSFDVLKISFIPESMFGSGKGYLPLFSSALKVLLNIRFGGLFHPAARNLESRDFDYLPNSLRFNSPRVANRFARLLSRSLVCSLVSVVKHRSCINPPGLKPISSEFFRSLSRR